MGDLGGGAELGRSVLFVGKFDYQCGRCGVAKGGQDEGAVEDEDG